MIELISERIIEYLFVHEYIKDDIPVYRYGTELLVSSVFGFLLVMLAGYFTHTLYDSLIFLVLFVFIRQRTGGYHASNYLLCNLLLLGIYLLYTLIRVIEITDLLLFMISLGSVLYIWKNAPVENINKKIKNRQSQKRYAIVISMFYMILLSLLMFLHSKFVYVPAYVLFAVAILIKVAMFFDYDEGIII